MPNRMLDLAYLNALGVAKDADGDVIVTADEGGSRTGFALTPTEALKLADVLREAAESDRG
jgi:hypothetical protein